MRENVFSVYSEIGKLERVLLHRPGLEVENLTPTLMERLLFDDIPYLKVAREEHDYFANLLRDNGAEVLYIEQLVADVIEDEKIKTQFLIEYIAEAGVFGKRADQLLEYFMDYKDNKQLVDKLVAGLRVEEFHVTGQKRLADMVEGSYPFVIDPMPNLYFTRDPFAVMGKGVTINKMATVTRNRETIFAKYIFKYHKDFKEGIPKYYERENFFHMEGGDELILSDEVLAIGISERTTPEAVEELANNVLRSGDSFKTILGFQIPSTRAFMHLDTVFTMVDRDKFTIHPEVEGPLVVFKLELVDDEIKITREEAELEEILKKYLHLDHVELIRCGGKKGIDADREQWNDGSNTLAIAPGEVVVYSRNIVTNRLLEEKGLKLHVIPSSELSRGRGGPRCMSMPLNRAKL